MAHDHVPDPQGLTFELPEDLRAEVLNLVTTHGVPLEALIALYRRGINAKIGATGQFPFGKLGTDDDGEFAVAIAVDAKRGVVRLHFGTPVTWLALPAKHCRRFAAMLAEKAGELERKMS